MTVKFFDSFRGEGEAIAGTMPSVGPRVAYEKQGGTNPVRKPDGYRPSRTQDYASVRFNMDGAADLGAGRDYLITFKLTLGPDIGSVIPLEMTLNARLLAVPDDNPPPSHGFNVRFRTEDGRIYVRLRHGDAFGNPGGTTEGFTAHRGAGVYDVRLRVFDAGMDLTLSREDMAFRQDFALRQSTLDAENLFSFMLDISNNANSAVADFQIGPSVADAPFWQAFKLTAER